MYGLNYGLLVPLTLFCFQLRSVFADPDAPPLIVTASSSISSNPIDNVLDANDTTFWQSETGSFPQSITLDIRSVGQVNSVAYTPRQDGSMDGNIGRHIIELSTDNETWTTVAQGYYPDDRLGKRTDFPPAPAQFIRLTALSEAGNRVNFSTIATLVVSTQPTADTSNPTTEGQWGQTIDFPLVPVAVGLAPLTGRIVTWSAYMYSYYNGSHGYTQTSTYDPSTGFVSERNVSNTHHDMFCPGISMDASGRMIVTGGDNAERTSIYEPLEDMWISGEDMTTPRGYQASAILSDGRIFTIGGSWSGGQFIKNGEVYAPDDDTWTPLPNAFVEPMLTNDSAGIYRADNHGWLFGWTNGSVFQAGPSRSMNWYSTLGNGSVSPAGSRANDDNSMCGSAVMYDAPAGKIVTMGGSPDYSYNYATPNTHVITIGEPGSEPQVEETQSMRYARIFANAVLLPNGQVLVLGGQSFSKPFWDNDAVLVPELWDPETREFTEMKRNFVPRTYHSMAILLPDGSVLSGGGGLCGSGCLTNHFDAQIFHPPYLFGSDGNFATRPVILNVSDSTVPTGGNFTVTTDSSVSSFSLVRYGTSTHTVNTDQRRIPITPLSTDYNEYTLSVPEDSGVALPGYWMLFALNEDGVPSMAETVRIV